MSRKTCHFSVRLSLEESLIGKKIAYTIPTKSKSVRSYLLFTERSNRIPCIVTGVRVEWKAE